MDTTVFTNQFDSSWWQKITFSNIGLATPRSDTICIKHEVYNSGATVTVSRMTFKHFKRFPCNYVSTNTFAFCIIVKFTSFKSFLKTDRPTSLSISAHFEEILIGLPSGPLRLMEPSSVFVFIFFA